MVEDLDIIIATILGKISLELKTAEWMSSVNNLMESLYKSKKSVYGKVCLKMQNLLKKHVDI